MTKIPNSNSISKQNEFSEINNKNERGRPINSNRDLIIYHTFSAPKDLIFRIFTQKEHLINWWGPEIVEIQSCDIDLKIGGKISILTKIPNKNSFLFEGEFLEIKENEKLVFSSNGFIDDFENSEIECLNILSFTEYKGRTTLKLHVKVIRQLGKKSQLALVGMSEGWVQSIKRIDQYCQKHLFN